MPLRGDNPVNRVRTATPQVLARSSAGALRVRLRKGPYHCVALRKCAKVMGDHSPPESCEERRGGEAPV
jgi:hypothetical protein